MVPHRSAIRDGVAPRVILSYARVRLNEEMPDHVRTHVVGLKTNYGSDGVHPNIRGYRVMRKMVLKAIDKIL